MVPDGAVLQLEDVPLEEPLELVVLEAVAVEEAREAHLAVTAHRLHAVVHRGVGGQVSRSFSKWFGPSRSGLLLGLNSAKKALNLPHSSSSSEVFP